MNGFMYPRTDTGNSSILPNPPWHYSGELITFEFRVDPAEVAALLPEGIDLADEDPGAVALIWADWQSCSDTFEEVLDPVRCQYKEAFVVVRCKYEGKTYSRCVYIWVDKDFAILRGQHQGYPKKLGVIHQTRPFHVGRAAPRVAAGGKFGVSLAAYERRLAEGVIELTGEADAPGFVNGHPMIHSRFMRPIENEGPDALDELVTMGGYDVDFGRCFKGDIKKLELFDSPVEELTRLKPKELIAAYWHEVGVSWKAGTTLKRNNL